ncbi:putative heme d1 biosynthesis radical SAM protein NirJ2 [Clostridium oryzae]|uniref:Antilisterial bacteriocin subtilosin biosynthesis protein AlbA n=1 Tax=Clostridium oryzae TaxID=1450648 RepID=A0A1V4IH23_9CLOT|nr:putative heme d1 biosynthesis radical SAM protein NirJ2 [Clostridium oryzae]OPJ59288.1 antilisterial bacteriocin subtilosin biosynthesis protein AlbA [Clostridium oryzae]
MIVSWNVTNSCNMYCEHCYRDAKDKAQGELTLAEGKKLLEEIAAAHFKVIIFSGGEPLMRPDIYELIQYASSLKLRPVLGSNGTLISSAVAQRLKSAGACCIGISLDSLDKMKHDNFRKFDGGWTQAVKGMKNCKAANLPFQIHTTVMKWNMDEIIALTDFAVAMGACGHYTFFLVPTGRGVNIEKESLSEQEYENLLRSIMLKQKQVKIQLKPTCAPQFMRIAKELNVKTRFTKGCLAGISYCIINPIGNVQPCAYLDLLIGNVREKPFDKIWNESPILNKLRTAKYEGKCGSCEHKDICGGCRARASFYNNGNYMGEEKFCAYHR